MERVVLRFLVVICVFLVTPIPAPIWLLAVFDPCLFDRKIFQIYNSSGV